MRRADTSRWCERSDRQRTRSISGAWFCAVPARYGGVMRRRPTMAANRVRWLSPPPPRPLSKWPGLARHCAGGARRPPANRGRRLHMQYMLMLYVNETGWAKMTKAEQEQGVAAYTAYTEALTKAGVLDGQQPPAAELVGDDGAHRERQVAGAGRPLCRLEGAARRLLPDRRARSRCRDLVGGALPRREPRRGRSAAGLGRM